MLAPEAPVFSDEWMDGGIHSHRYGAMVGFIAVHLYAGTFSIAFKYLSSRMAGADKIPK